MIILKSTLESVLADIETACLFGRLFLTSETMGDELRSIVLQLGGRVDLQVFVEKFDAREALNLLNDGAAEIVIRPEDFDEFASVIPPNRLRVRFSKENEGLDCCLKYERALIQGNPFSEQELQWIAERAKGRSIQVEFCLSDVSKEYASNLHAIHCESVVEWEPAKLADSVSEMLVSDRPDGLWPTLIVDRAGIALGLAYSNSESLAEAIQSRSGVYWSRSREALWIKGKTSGARQQLHQISLDCDSDCLRFVVTQAEPGFCHRHTYTCFGDRRSLPDLMSRLEVRIHGEDQQSFTRKLANDPKMLEAKLLEEAQELAEASAKDDVAWEAADVLYFTLIKLASAGVEYGDVLDELARRMNRVERRPNKLETK